MQNTFPSTCPCRELEETRKPVYRECCQPFHLGRADNSVLPQTAEQLMRSRYSAFVLVLAPYLLQTWHPSTRPASLELDEQLQWAGLEILTTRAGGESSSRGVVEFIAHYRQDGAERSQREMSTFVREDGAWYYVDAL